MYKSSLTSILLLAPAILAAPGQVSLQARQDQYISSRAQAVKDAFQFAWDGYYKHAFPNDQLNPTSLTVQNPRNGWGATAVDALSTAIVMGHKDIVNQILDYIPTIDYSKSVDDTQVSLFETTIRYLGGMLSAYDFLSGPLADLAENKTNVDALLKQSINLANILSFAFDTPSGVPSNNLYFGNRTYDNSETNGIAQIGTLVLEWTRLSDLTGNLTYSKLAQKGQDYLLNPSPAENEPWPGLIGTDVSIKNGSITNAVGGWVGGTDSFYEYLIKMYVYDPSRFGNYKDRWVAAAESSIAHLASHPSSRPDLTYLAIFSNKDLILTSQHLACFDGGNFILGGTVLGRQDFIDFGLNLTAACRNTYASTLTGFGPEIFAWDKAGVPANQSNFFAKNGFYITDSFYDLRPEVVESYYHAYQATGDTKYQDWAWDAFVALNKTCRTTAGFTAITDVNAENGGEGADYQESFLFAELMKYLYLIQAPQAPWDIAKDGKNQWVFNTEAHPFKVVSQSSYTSSTTSNDVTPSPSLTPTPTPTPKNAALRITVSTPFLLAFTFVALLGIHMIS